MAVGNRVVAASTVSLFLLSFLSILKVKICHKVLLGCVPCGRALKWPACVLQVFHNGISAELNPAAGSLFLSLQTLEAQLVSQKERYTVTHSQRAATPHAGDHKWPEQHTVLDQQCTNIRNCCTLQSQLVL